MSPSRSQRIHDQRHARRDGERESCGIDVQDIDAALRWLVCGPKPRDVADVMEKAGFKVDRHQVSISQAIKTVGLFTIPVVLHREVKVNVTVNVARSEDESDRQARGENVLAEKTEAEEARVAAEELFEEGAGLKEEA